MEDTNTELGQATYEAYVEHREAAGCSHDSATKTSVVVGATFPTWDQLTSEIKSAWIAAGERALQKGLQQIAPDEP